VGDGRITVKKGEPRGRLIPFLAHDHAVRVVVNQSRPTSAEFVQHDHAVRVVNQSRPTSRVKHETQISHSSLSSPSQSA
jgi:hypothetical protein